MRRWASIRRSGEYQLRRNAGGAELRRSITSSPGRISMQNTTMTADTSQIALLNDLLQLDHDAVHTYSLTIRQLKNETYQEMIRSFRSDHERHIEELTQLIEQLGGSPASLPHASAVLKLDLQIMAGIAGDAAVLMAFRANERQVRDKYQRAADMALPGTAAATVMHAASDEARHFEWVDRTLRQLGYTEKDFERAAARMHKRTADVLERGERFVRRNVSGSTAAIAGTALAVIGAGFILAKVLRR
jgi:rubrerythrin